MTTTQTHLETISAALPADVKAAIATIAAYVDAPRIGPQASAAAIARSRLAPLIDVLNRSAV
jgi:hypothetical protein